jgi:ribosomal protein S27E
MKVVKDGTKNIKITCEYCNSTLEYEQEDINYKTKKELSNVVNERRVGLFKKEYWSTVYSVTIGYIICPICGKELVVKHDFESDGEKIFDRKELTSW